MRHRTAHLITTATTIAALLTGGLWASSAAHADPTPPCYGASCNGKDPHALGCDGSFARTLASFPVSGGTATLSLRYSDWCHANWALVSTPGNNFGVDFWVENSYKDNESAGAVSGTSAWTDMVNGIPTARACAVDNFKYPPTHPGCTGWY
jgi:hypothetical protein